MSSENTHPPAGEHPMTAAQELDQLTSFAEMLTQIDEFLRTGDHVAHHLADFLSTGPGDTGQVAAYCLIDTFSFTAARFSRQADAARAARPEGSIGVFPDTLDDAAQETE